MYSGGKEKLRKRLEYAGSVAGYILSETLQKGGYPLKAENIALQSEMIAEEICLYCGANAGFDFYDDDDMIKSALIVMSEGNLVYSEDELKRLKSRINEIIPKP